MLCKYACQSSEHLMARRGFLGAMAGTALAGSGIVGGLDVFTRSAQAEQLVSQQKRVVVFNMHGGLSQLETWDPKPGTDTGGPFMAIPTSVPGIHVSELLPETAKVMHHMCLARGVNTAEDDHAKGAYYVLTGHRQVPGQSYPNLGAVMAKSIAPSDTPLPGHVLITPGGAGQRSADSAYLGPRYASVVLGNGNPPSHLKKPDIISDQAELARHDFRRKVNERFLSRRRTAITDAYTNSYEQALQLMQRADTFDVSQESATDQERYGSHDLGRHCLLARRLLEKGVSFVQVTHSNYDTHNENFNFHLEQVGEFDRPFAMLVQDLADRGMLESTLIVVLSEFGRTPNVNLYYGRDHWSSAWSIAMAGCKLPRGAVYGSTNDKGTAVTDGQCDGAQLFHTYLAAVGVDSSGSFDLDGREFPIADPAASPIKALIS